MEKNLPYGRMYVGMTNDFLVRYVCVMTLFSVLNRKICVFPVKVFLLVETTKLIPSVKTLIV